MSEDHGFAFHPLTPDRWTDLETLFGPKGAADGCWCMYWRVTAGEWKSGKSSDRKDAFRNRVDGGPPPGVLAYQDDEPVGWVQVTPRQDVPRYNRTRTGKPLSGDDASTHAHVLSCFFIRKDMRNKGLMRAWIDAAVDFGVSQGGRVFEAAPLIPKRVLMWGEGYVGIASAFRACGFEEVERRTPIRPLMRKVI